MTVLIQGDQLRTLLFGNRVANAAGKTVPQNATSTIFTVSVGRILITSLVGNVTTQIGGTTPPIKLIATPTTGTATDMCTAFTATGTEVGTLLSLTGPVGSALAGTINRSGAVGGMTAAQIVAVGTIGVNCTAADATGAILWTMTYVPLDNGATVVAA